VKPPLECVDCGTKLTFEKSRIDTVAGDHYCRTCSPINDCARCSRSTRETTLDGTPLCNPCQERKRREDATRDAEQDSLGRWSR
jgi:hypothetical protein